MTHEAHPAAELFPLMTEEALRELTDDIREHGLRQPIVIDPDGRVLDGRNRLTACVLAEVDPEFSTWDGDPFALVVSMNVKRRNLTASQRAVVAAEAWDMVTLGQGARTDVTSGQNTPKSERTKDRLASMFGVSDKYVQQARALVERAPEAAQSVKRGEADLTKTYANLREREAALEDERTKAKRAADEAAREAEGAQRMYEELLALTPADVDPEPLRPEELSVAGADIELLATASQHDEEQPQPLDKRPEIEAQKELVLAVSALATRISNASPVLPDDRFRDVSVLAARDAVRRLTQNATEWLRALNEQYAQTREEA